MAHVLDSFATTDLVTAIKANMVEFWMHYGQLPTGERYEDSNLVGFNLNIPHPLYNQILRTQLSPEHVESAISETLNRCANKQLPLLWWTSPTTQPSDLGKHLKAQGVQFLDELTGMVIALDAIAQLSSAQVEIRQVQDADTLASWVQIAMVGFDVPAALFDTVFAAEASLGIETHTYRRYVALWQNQPVATSSLYLGAGVAGIYFVATLPEARKQGIGMAVTQAALQDARALGYRIAVLQAAPIGVNVYRRLGFQACCPLGLYVWQPS